MVKKTALHLKVRSHHFTSDHLFDFFAAGILLVIVFITLYPIYFVLIASFSDQQQVSLGNVWLFPKGIQFFSYQLVFQNQSIWTAYRNTILYTVFGTLIDIICTMTAAFVFSRKNLAGTKICMMLILFTMYFSGGLIPTYFNIRNLGLLNTPWALILPGAISGYNLIIARTFIRSTIPDALQEAASIDGCSHIRFFVTIVIPLSTPIIGVLTLYCAVGFWNSYMDALIYLKDRSLYPLQLILREILVQSTIDVNQLDTGDAMNLEKYRKLSESMKYALVIVSSLPILILYPFLQRFFVKGIMIGSVKG